MSRFFAQLGIAVKLSLGCAGFALPVVFVLWALPAGKSIGLVCAVAAALFAAAGGVMFLAVSHVVTGPLEKIRLAMDRLADGDLDGALPAMAGRDVFRDLLSAMRALQLEGQQKRRHEAGAAITRQVRERQQDAMQRHNNDFGVSVSGVLASMSESAASMHKAASEMVRSVERTRASSANSAAGARRSAQSLTSVAAATEELTGSVDEIGRQVREAAATARDGVARAEATGSTVRSLSESASQIGDVARLIAEIASKTNLLALNATIEAARAGDAGKGFAVVAAEVKMLAAQTAQATQQIGTQIEAIQAGTGLAVEAVHGMGDAIVRMDEVASAIAMSVEAQGAATREIAGSVQAVSQQNEGAVADIREVSAMAETSSSASEIVLQASDDVAKVSKALLEEIDHYLAAIRVDNDDDRRKWVRLATDNLTVSLKPADGPVLAASMADLSRGGASLMCPAILMAGTNLELELPAGAGPVHCRVVRSVAGKLGVAFRQDPASLARIDQAMGAVCQRPSAAA